MDESTCDGHTLETGIILGFLEEAEPWQLKSCQFPSKIGGKPAWLSQSDLPSGVDLQCEKCHLPTAFLLQVYAPIVGQDRSFHRALFVFCCKTPSCYSCNDSRCFKVFRSQLPRKNDFYPYDPPHEEKPVESESDSYILATGIKLCWLCGCPGSKLCSRCHLAAYCSKEHQTIDWKTSHKNVCSGKDPPFVRLNTFAFPELELVTEPEEMQLDDTQSKTSQQTEENSDFKAEQALEENELEEMAMRETQDSKMFQKFKQRTALEPHQVLRYCREGSPLWLSVEHIPTDEQIPKCVCGATRVFEFQVMPQLLNHLHVDNLESSIDWGTLAIYTCKNSCDQGNRYSPEFLWKQDVTGASANKS